MEKTRVIIYGCGVMGQKTAEVLFEKESFDVVGALDINPDLIGKDLGSILDTPIKSGILIESEVDTLFSRVKADAVVLTTSSHLQTVFSQIAQCAKAGLNVVSTCEELSYPWVRNPKLAKDIDDLAKKQGVTIVGTGINPGYLMDTLPLILTAPCFRVDSVFVTRMMNSAKRRLPFQKKVGTNMTQEEFMQKIKNKVITGHVGLLESINMIAEGLGWTLDDAVELPPQPVIADRDVETGLGTVKTGDVIGLTSIAFATKDNKDVIRLEFNANAGVSEEYDEIVIHGIPDIHEKIIGGIHGDIGTVAVTINILPRVIEAPPGLKLMKDLPPAIATR